MSCRCQAPARRFDNELVRALHHGFFALTLDGHYFYPDTVIDDKRIL